MKIMNDEAQTEHGSDAGATGENQSDNTKNTDQGSAAASGAGENNQGTDNQGQNQGNEDGKTDAQKAEESRLAGIRSEIGAEEERLRQLRLEKRTLNQPQGTQSTNDNGGSGEEPTPREKELQEKLSAHQEAIQREAIEGFSKDTKFKLVNPGHDMNNANWNKMLQENPIHIEEGDTKETIATKLKRSYYATFGEQLESDAAERGRANGQADAATAAAADTGGVPSGGTSDNKIVLTPEQRAAAKKLGQSEEEYAQGLKLQQEHASNQ